MRILILISLVFFLTDGCKKGQKTTAESSQTATSAPAQTTATSPTQTTSNTAAKSKDIVQVKPIVFYGDPTCKTCVVLKEECEERGIKFEFVDLNTEAGGNAFAERLQQSDFKGEVSIPMLEIDGQLYMKPSIHKVIDLIK